MKTKKKRISVFDKNYAPYGRYDDGVKGNPQQWSYSFKQRFSENEIEQILGKDDPWNILNIPIGSSQSEIKRAFFQRAKETHPDHNPQLDGSEFRKVKAAYEKLFMG